MSAHKPTRTAKPQPVTLDPKSQPTRELTPLQQLIADEIADILVHGGYHETVQSLIWCAAAHKTWRWAKNNYGESEQSTIDDLMTECPRQFDNWLEELTAEWRRNRQVPAVERVAPKTAADRIRARFMDELRERMATFMVESTPEEQHVMLDILTTHESSNRGRSALDKMPLGAAIQDVLGEGWPDWVRVPRSMSNQVESYIACLKAAERKSA